MPPKRKCDCPPTCPCECPCEPTACWELADPPAATTCGGALDSVVNELLAAPLLHHDEADTPACTWWALRCGSVGELFVGYAIVLRQQPGDCAMTLEVLQNCSLTEGECCLITSPPGDGGNWHRVVLYSMPVRKFLDCVIFDLTLTKKIDTSGCNGCEVGGIEADWPDTIDISPLDPCPDDTLGGDDCFEEPPPTSCCAVDIQPHSVEYIATIESDCPALDGKIFRLKWVAGNIWWNTWSFSPRSDTLGTACDPAHEGTCTMPMTFSCAENDPGTGDWFLGTSVQCTSWTAFCDLDDGFSHTHEGPIAGDCDPLTLTFERHLIPHGTGCGDCGPCTVFITITVAP